MVFFCEVNTKTHVVIITKQHNVTRNTCNITQKNYHCSYEKNTKNPISRSSNLSRNRNYLADPMAEVGTKTPAHMVRTHRSATTNNGAPADCPWKKSFTTFPDCSSSTTYTRPFCRYGATTGNTFTTGVKSAPFTGRPATASGAAGVSVSGMPNRKRLWHS